MDDFLKDIKDNLENRPEPAFEASAWERMRQRLAEEPKPENNRTLFPWWWILGILGVSVLTISNAILWNKWQQAQHQLATLSILKQTDTIYKTKVIYHTDTIYKEVGSASRWASMPVAASYFQNQRPAIPLAFKSNLKTIGVIPNRIAYSNTANPTLWQIRQSLDLDKEAPNAIVSYWEQLPYLPNLPLKGVVHADQKEADFPVGHIFLEQKKASFFERVGQVFEPVGFDLGGSVGYAGLFQDGVNNDHGFSAGLNGQIRFSDKLQMWLDVSFYQLQYVTNRMDSLLGVPVVASPSDNFLFNKATVPQNSIQYSIGMQYTFVNRSRWQPYFGVGYGAASLLPYEVQYEFWNSVNEVELTIDQLVEQRDLITDLLLFKGGINYEFAKKYSLLLEGNYRYSLHNKGMRAPNIWGVKTGILYHF
jgi:hypothetical protein